MMGVVPRSDAVCGQRLEATMSRIVVSLMICFLGFCGQIQDAKPKPETRQGAGSGQMRLGNFSVSLAVKDLGASRAFYEKLGFRSAGGDAKKWLILQNETSTIGLFQGLFEKNMLTFNPGWDRTKATLPDFDDVRDIQRTLKSKGLTLLTSADESTNGPASLMLLDPDGNPILIDQHVASPRK
jgi:catechol 2,3-dioxygenase-like lactoylglutathione lyase family enzyme